MLKLFIRRKMVEMDCKSDLKSSQRNELRRIYIFMKVFPLKKANEWNFCFYLITGQQLFERDDRAFQSTWILMVCKGHHKYTHTEVKHNVKWHWGEDPNQMPISRFYIKFHMNARRQTGIFLFTETYSTIQMNILWKIEDTIRLYKSKTLREKIASHWNAQMHDDANRCKEKICQM